MRLRGKQLDAINAALKSGLDVHAAVQNACKQVESVGQPAPDEGKWLIWSIEHNAWWAPTQRGYCHHRVEAGRYTYEEACEIVYDANQFVNGHDAPHEAMVKDEPIRWLPPGAIGEGEK